MLRDAFNKAPEIVEPTLQKAIDATQAIMERSKGEAGSIVPWRTGYLTKTWRFESRRLEAIYYPTASYAQFVNDGYLRTTGWFGRKLKNPFQVPGRNYMEKLVEVSKPDVAELFAHALEIITQNLAAEAKK